MVYSATQRRPVASSSSSGGGGGGYAALHQQQSKRSASVDPHNRSAESSGDDAEGAAASRHVSLQTQKHHQRRVNNNDRHEATTGYQYIADDHHRQHIAAEQHQQRVQQEYQRRVVGVAAGEVIRRHSGVLLHRRLVEEEEAMLRCTSNNSKRSASVDPHNRSAESSGDDAEGAAASRHVSLQTQKHHQRRVNNNDRHHEATTGYQYIADDHHRQHIAAEQHQQRVQQEYQRRVVGVAAGEVAKVASSPLSIPSHSRRSRTQKQDEEHRSPYSSPRGNSNHAAVPTTKGFVHATSKNQQRGAHHHQHHHHQAAEAAAPSITPHSYTIALRAQWSALSRLMREEGLGNNSGDAEYDGGVPSSVIASRIAVRSGLDVEITRLLAAIRSDATAVVHEADVLLPLLLALSIAPIPTESSQTLAAEVLGKVLVAAHRQSVTSSAQQHNSTTTAAQQQQQQMVVQRRRMLENFLVHHRALDALEIALRTSVSSAVTTSILELYFVVASISPQSSNAILANPSLIQTLMALLPAGVPAHICYVATLLQSLTQSSPIDGATILCSYDVHHAMLAFLDHHLEDEITVTAVGMLLRVVLVLHHGCPQAFRQAFATTTTSVSATATHHRPNGPHALARLIRRCIGSVWSDIADLGCLLLTSHLQRHHSARLERNALQGGVSSGGRSATARRRSDAVGAVSEHAPTLEELRDFTRVEMLLETPSSSSSAAWPNSTTSLVNASSSRRPSTSQFAAAATAVPNDLILVLSSLICATPTTAMPQQGHLRISSACALLWLSFHAPIRVGELIANDPIVIHNLVSTLLESFSDDESIHPNAASTSSELTSMGHNGESPSRRRQAASSSGQLHPSSPSSQPYQQAHRTLTALTMLTILFVGSPRSRLSLTTHLQRHLSKTTRATLFQRLVELLLLADDTLLSALLFDVRGAREAASVDPAAAAADGQQHASPSHEYQLQKLRQALLTVARDVLLTVPKTSSIAAATNYSTSFSSSRYDNHNGDHHQKQHHHEMLLTPYDNHNGDHHQKQHHHEMLLTPGGMASTVTRLVDNAVVLQDQPRSSAHSAKKKKKVEHLERNDVFLFDCPVEQLTPGLHEVMEGLALHVARLKHELNLNSMSKPMRRCVLQDLYSHVYPTMLTCLQFIAQSLSSDEHAANTIRMIADGGGSRAISSANIVDIYHAVGLSMLRQQQR
ncbi:Hypothetical protein, putative [Bodo saltans]|uniref:Uncharacterized protein n=1 Tax=Bodo saltans TaxID=75058 RepID=A0A0S4JE67_BODSA|nr:Hypothetical protein, putative [Bodo saltans]|eukprot:CUG88413.1 Hypothetical protein, putative [Bodo saltans]